MVVRQEVSERAELDAGSLLGRRGDHEVGCRAWLVTQGVVFGVEHLIDSILVSPASHLHVPGNHFVKGFFMRGVGQGIRDAQDAEFHCGPRSAREGPGKSLR